MLHHSPRPRPQDLLSSSPGGLLIQRRGRVLRHTAAELHGAAAQQGRGGDGVEPGGMSSVFVEISLDFMGIT